jgi:hypothetical protein
MRRFAVLAALVSTVACSAASERGDNAFGSPDGGDTGTGINLGEDGGISGDAEGTLDPEKDNDGDGFLFKDDCNDRNPEVNAGAFEVPGDGVDNDCDGTVDNAEPNCDTLAIKYDSTSPMDFAKALGLCRTTTTDSKKWGLIKAELVRADGKGTVDPLQFGILKKFGTNIAPRNGSNFIALSSGTARTPDYPGFEYPLFPSFTTTSEVTPPAGFPKNTPGCPDPDVKTANDSVNLKLTIRVPTNAKAFSFDFNFYSSEYITFVCDEYNDSFVAILNSKAPIDPKFNKNVAVDIKGNPINVNSGFFEVCTPGTSPSGKTFACGKGTKELEGTGFLMEEEPTEGGATSWLTTTAPVVPGETITMQFMIWDTGTDDHVLDSTVLIDNWKWDAKATTAPVTDRPK